ncbi:MULTISPECIES: XkdX family protein [Bacillus subtilis group]|uniref:XkdX family protein n=1 Tax=Bacillus subtilis group TaxID=653685 RepID=UPI000E2E6755|nr:MULTISPECIES: XkdX family protein [Bacillus subtilis group]MCY7919571.1 XkdX family protein [Bacillus vallismortis]
MDWFKCIENCFKWGCYTSDDVRKFVGYEKITAEQFKKITGEDYATPSEGTSETTDGSTGYHQVS